MMEEKQSKGRRQTRPTRLESKQETRERLLRAAEEVFARKGFHGASVEDVAECAGFSTGAVYSNFGGKDDLFLALFDRKVERWGPQFVEAFGVEPLGARSAAIVSVLARVKSDNDKLTWTMLELEFFLYAMRDGSAREKLAQRHRGIREALVSALEQHVGEQQGPLPIPPEVLAWVLPALSVGFELQAGVEPEAAPDDIWGAVLKRLLDNGTS